MSSLATLKEYWRIVMLVILIVASTAAIAVPGAVIGDSPDVGAGNETVESQQASGVNLKYGLELAGGTSVRAPLTGVSAADVQVDRDDRANVSRSIASELAVEGYDVRIRYTSAERVDVATVEVYQDIDSQRLAAALENTSADTSEMELSDDLSEATYDEAEATLRARIMQTGLSGGQVTQSVSTNGDRYLVVKVPNEDQQEVLDLIGKRGLLRVDGVYPVEAGNGTYEYESETIVTQSDIHSVGQIDESNGQPGVPVTLTDEGAKRYVEFLDANGYLTEEGIGNCAVRGGGASNLETRGFCLLTFQDDEFMHGGGISSGLADQMKSGQFYQSPTIVMITEDRNEARELQVTLRAGAMPASVDVDRGTVQYLSPSQASEFKLYSLLIGLLTVLAVAGSVAYRYRDPVVAAPMTLIAMSEVWVLLGFVALVQLPLDLSHIAGLIAVVGTGVDDLIIIADEVMAGGDISTKRVFESRFKKAFWVIGVAAITTIVAMSPLAALSLGDLQGFAIVTIVGVLIGVLITRPAYGDILKWIVDRRGR